MIVYRIISPSRRSYIGQTSGNVWDRLHQHTKDWNKRKYPHFQIYRAFDKYGCPTNADESPWRIQVLWSCRDKATLNQKERDFIEYYDSIRLGYNMVPGGQGGDQGPEINKRIGDTQRGVKCPQRGRQGIERPWLKRTRSPEARARMSAAKIAYWGKMRQEPGGIVLPHLDGRRGSPGSPKSESHRANISLGLLTHHKDKVGAIS